MSDKRYGADEITVLKDLEPVQLRPGMYTDTTRPNHLGQEVIDNSVDEALSGYASHIDVILHADNSLELITGEACRLIFTLPKKFQGWS